MQSEIKFLRFLFDDAVVHDNLFTDDPERFLRRIVLLFQRRFLIENVCLGFLQRIDTLFRLFHAGRNLVLFRLQRVDITL